MPVERWENEGGRVRGSQGGKRPGGSARDFTTRIDIPAEKRRKLVALLNQQLADTFDLYSQAKQAHWNVKGPQFHQLHTLFDQFAAEVLGYIDLIAERATTLGGAALGTIRLAAAASRLPEYPMHAGRSMDHIAALAERTAALAATTRAAITAADKLGDVTTADLFTGVSQGLDKSLWFLEAHTQA